METPKKSTFSRFVRRKMSNETLLHLFPTSFVLALDELVNFDESVEFDEFNMLRESDKKDEFERLDTFDIF
jgi:hypothetical protein